MDQWAVQWAVQHRLVNSPCRCLDSTGIYATFLFFRIFSAHLWVSQAPGSSLGLDPSDQTSMGQGVGQSENQLHLQFQVQICGPQL